MPALANSQVPPDPDSQQSESNRAGGPEGKIAGDWTTLGHARVQRFLRWADGAGCLVGALRLAEASLYVDDPRFLGSIVAFAAQGGNCSLLELWRDEVAGAGDVSDTGMAVWASLESDAQLPRVDPAERVSQAMRGRLQTAYLAALCAARRPPVAADVAGRIEAVRVWVLARALDYAAAGNLSDFHLRRVASALRRACDEPRFERILSWFGQLRVDPESFLLTAEHFADQTAAWAKSKEGLKAPSGLRALASSMLAVATAREQRIELAHAPVIRFPREVAGSLPEMRVDSVSSADDRAQGIEDAESRVEYVEVLDDPEASPPQATKAARAVLLASTEDAQQLPFSWNRLTRDETRSLVPLTIDLASSADASRRLLGSLIVLAWISGRSLRTVLALGLGGETIDEWRVDLGRGCLHRTPARRQSRWRADEAAIGWIRPLADRWQLPLAEQVIAPLREALARANGAPDLGALWAGVSDQSPEALFHSVCEATPLRRASSGLLSRSAAQRAFEHQPDLSFVRLLTSQPRSALPGACAYPSWTSAQVHAGWINAIAPQWTRLPTDNTGVVNALGSELDPLDQQLRAAIAECASRLSAAGRDPSAWVERHNLTTTYCAVALLAATGARPVESPFESPGLIDWEERFIVIDDKSSGADRTSRAVP